MRLSHLAAAAALAFGAATVPAQATTTFAQFIQLAPGKPFVHTGGDGGANFAAITGTVLGVLDFGPLGFYGVDLAFNASSSGSIIDTGFTWEQGGWNGSLLFTSGSTNVLTVTFTDATLSITKGPGGNQSGSLIGSGICGTDVCFSSDVLSVNNLYFNNFALSFSGIQRPQGGGGIAYGANGGNFIASGSGTFAGAIPEPATWALMIAGFGLVGAAARRRRIAVAAN
ncbi:MAG: PEPxxWA-CTERM sorting domain-containing protein [Sphingomonadaceae bacterium]